MSWERDFNNNKQKREDRRKQKDQAREIYPDDDHIKHCCRNPQKTRQELKNELNHLDDF